jgi:hypothetical protein
VYPRKLLILSEQSGINLNQKNKMQAPVMILNASAQREQGKKA